MEKVHTFDISSPLSTVSCFSYHSLELAHDGVPSASEKQATRRTVPSQYKGSIQHLNIGVEGKGEPEQEVQDAGHEESEFWGPQRQSTEDRRAW